MTKDEARTILAMMASDRHEAEADALLMAIDALSVDGDLISRQDAIEAVGEWMQKEFGFLDLNRAERLIDALSALPSAEAEPTVIRSKTLMPTKDFKEWAKRVRETNPNAVVIPCDAEVVYSEAVQIPIKLEKRYPESKDEDITDAFMRGYLAGRSSAEAVQGEWVRKYDDKINCYWYECDQCGEYRPRNQFGHEYNSNFCPNCGARMKGGDSE